MGGVKLKYPLILFYFAGRKVNSPPYTPKPPINSAEIAEIDSVIYEIADMLKTLPPAEIQKVLLKLREALMFEYVYSTGFNGVLIQYSTAPFSQSQDMNIKYRELLRELVQILNKVMVPDLMLMKKIRIINYIVNTIKNIALS